MLKDVGSFFRQAFARNSGLIGRAEQEQLRESCVAIPGLGGVGGAHLLTLVRAGIGSFHIADFDRFETANFNRQAGAKSSTLGLPKLEVMAREAEDINPHLSLQLFAEGLTPENMDRFLEGVDVLVDGLDFFVFDLRRRLFNRCRELGITVVTAGPIGFGTAMLIFTPDGMSFDEYFDIKEEMTAVQKTVAFQVGLTPRLKYLSYIDLSSLDHQSRAGPSLSLACQLAAGMAGAEVLRVLLKRGAPRAVPCYSQFDPYLRRYYTGRLWLGNRHPLQRLKRKVLEYWIGKPVKRASRQPPLPTRGEPESAPLSGPVCDYILRAAVQAPSGDNVQPWRFSLDPSARRIALYGDFKADRSRFNDGQIATYLACGAALENMLIAAEACALRSRLELFPDRQRDDLVARIDFERGEDRVVPLLEAVWQRETNRTMYRADPLLPAVSRAVRACAAEFPGVTVALASGAAPLRQLAAAARLADRVRLTDRSIHEYLNRMIRFSPKEAERLRDGLPLKNLEAGLAGEIFLRCTRSWSVMRPALALGAEHLVSRLATRGVMHAAGACLISAPGISPGELVQTGRVLERVWLTLTRLGLAVQPLAAAPLLGGSLRRGTLSFSASAGRLLEASLAGLRAVFPGEGGHPVMLLRFGAARPVRHGTYRREPGLIEREGGGS